MKKSSIAFASGLLFGIGLLVSRMADPAKVLNFLDIAQQWDPSLPFVMASALVIAAIGYALGRRLPAAWDGTRFPNLPRSGITPRLVIGALIFGAGWALVGFCPGPAIVALPIRPDPVAMFVAAMLLGLWGVQAFSAMRERQTAGSEAAKLDSASLQNSR